MIRPRVAALAVVASLAAGCATKTPPRPGGTPIADPSVVTAFVAATSHCRPLSTATAEIRLSGRAAATRVSGRLLAGFAAPSSLRLEALAPFGAPALILVSNGGPSTLYFPRDRQVLRDAPVAAVLEALTGLALGADELRLMLFGCLASSATQGERYGDHWAAARDGEARVFLKSGVPVAADYRGWLIDYAGHVSGIPREVRVRRSLAAGNIDLRATLGQLELNTTLDERAFTVQVPEAVDVITLDDLRRSSPLSTGPGSH